MERITYCDVIRITDVDLDTPTVSAELWIESWLVELTTR